MAGPVASLLLPEPLTAGRLQTIWDTLRQISEPPRGNEVQIRGRPFLLSFGPEHPGELDGIIDEEQLPIVLGWTPRDIVSVIAFCNGDIDHRLLGLVCVRLCEALDGLIDFGGTLAVGPDLSGPSWSPPVRRTLLGGVLYATSYAIDEHRYGGGHYGDRAFLQGWLQDPRFRLVN